MISYVFKEGNTTLNQFKRSLNKETFNELHSTKYKFMLMEKKTLLEANNKNKMINFYQVNFSVLVSLLYRVTYCQ